jgi:hypothetical protein
MHVEVRAGGARQVAGGPPGRRARRGPGAADAQQVARGAGLGRDLVGEGIVPRSVAVENGKVQQTSLRGAVGGQEVEVMGGKLGEIGGAGGDVRPRLGLLRAGDLGGDLPQDLAPVLSLGIGDPGEAFAVVGCAEEAAGGIGRCDAHGASFFFWLPHCTH